MSEIGISVAAAEFGRNMEQSYNTIGHLIGQARTAGSSLLVLPEACLGGYLPSLGGGDESAEERERRLRRLPRPWTWTARNCAASSTWPATSSSPWGSARPTGRTDTTQQ